MLTARLHQYIEPLKFANRGEIIKGELPLGLLSRLAEFAVDGDEESTIEIDLQFDTDNEGYRYISGSLTANVQLECQRCLKPVFKQIESEISLAIVKDEARAEKLPDYYDPLIISEDRMQLSTLIEEEILLALPLVSYHEDCEQYNYRGQEKGPAEKTQKAAKADNPFAALSALKRK